MAAIVNKVYSNSPSSILHAQTRCRSVHACGFTAGQENCGKSGPGRRAVAGRGPPAAGQRAFFFLAKPELPGYLFLLPVGLVKIKGSELSAFRCFQLLLN